MLRRDETKADWMSLKGWPVAEPAPITFGGHRCQIAWNRDPCFASSTDPLEDRAELIHVGVSTPV